MGRRVGRGGGWCRSAVVGKLRPSRQGTTIMGALTILAQARIPWQSLCSDEGYRSLSIRLGGVKDNFRESIERDCV